MKIDDGREMTTQAATRFVRTKAAHLMGRWHRLLAMMLVLVSVCCAAAYAQEDDVTGDDFKEVPTAGERAFTSNCAGCHGLDGRGGDKAPNIAGSIKLQRISDAQLASIISNGVPGTGMPAFRLLKPLQVRAVVAYLRALQGQAAGRALPGDATQGKKIFFGKGECSSCHSVSGEGGFLGPDLTNYGPLLSAESILASLLNPARNVAPGYKSAVLVTHDGSRVEGVVRNEDNFSVQLQTKDGAFLFLEKSELQSLEYSSQSLMSANYGERLSCGELNDLVSYLMTTSSSPQKAHAPIKP